MRTRRLYYGDLVNRASPLNRGLVSWWLCVPWYMSGPRFVDIAGRNHGTLTNGPTWSGNGRVGGYGSVSFDGTNDYIATNWLVQLSSTYTLAAWIKCTNVARADLHDIFNTRSLDTGATGVGVIAYILGSALNITNIGGSTVTGAATLTSNTWFHAIWSVSSGTAQMYVNGVASGSSGSLGTYGTTTQTLLIGASDNTNARWFSGSLDDLRVWPTRSLTAAESLALYNASLRGYQNELNWLRRPSRGAAAAVSVSGVSFNAYGGSSGGVPTFISG